MTQKEKAAELVDKFTQTNGNAFFAKECALITVDKIIESKKLEYLFTFQEITLLNFTKDDRLIHSKFINYWEEVKNEIKKL